mmetsp:Transcript_12194/g.20208  ORF Transcript_12194/g.20208 Transcript_12194/m.20208 type:complete len:567 (+) Transcript_12194:39-1739(+)
MQFSTAISLFLAGASVVSASTLRNTQEQSACLKDVAIDWTSTCTRGTVLGDIDEALKGLEVACPHNNREEAKLLAGTINFGVAKQILQAKCLDENEPCFEDIEAFAESADFKNCTNAGVADSFATALDDAGCLHNNRKEILRLTGMDNVADAKKELVAVCLVTRKACLSFDDLVFQTPVCTPAAILEDIEAQMLAKSCVHDTRTEAKLLTKMESFPDAKKALRAKCQADLTPCTNLANVDINLCDRNTVVRAIKQDMSEDCAHSVQRELMILTGASSKKDAESYIAAMCDGVWSEVETTTFEDIDPDFVGGDFVSEYYEGGTFLNSETSNFRRGLDDNENYPISDQTQRVGENIVAFRNDEAATTMMGTGAESINRCENQAIMCCFGRDRQSGDDNGNCDSDDCDDADPGDNTDLCSVAGDEDDIHCHGVAWAADNNDATSRMRLNNLFFVSLFDHMYTRGYVGDINAPANSAAPMCGCIEDMPVVSRADCTQIDAELTVTLNIDADGLLTAATQEEPDLQVNFNACRAETNNDLASYVEKLANQKKISTEMKDVFSSIVVGTCPA